MQYESIEKAYYVYERERREENGLSGLVGDQPTFKNFFWIFYDTSVFCKIDAVVHWGITASLLKNMDVYVKMF